MQAYDEYQRIRYAIAFTIADAVRRNVNQYVRDYTFGDGSVLRIFKAGFAHVVERNKGNVVVCGAIRCNAFGR